MPVAAVPSCLGQDFTTLRGTCVSGCNLKPWGVNRRSHALLWTTHDVGYEVRGQQHQDEVRYENKVSAISDARRLSNNDKRVMCALLERQGQTFDELPASRADSLRLDARAIAPFTTGLGTPIPLKNGFAFLNPYGLPYLPGSGVKGVLRQVWHANWRAASGAICMAGARSHATPSSSAASRSSMRGNSPWRSQSDHARCPLRPGDTLGRIRPRARGAHVLGRDSAGRGRQPDGRNHDPAPEALLPGC